MMISLREFTAWWWWARYHYILYIFGVYVSYCFYCCCFGRWFRWYWHLNGPPQKNKKKNIFIFSFNAKVICYVFLKFYFSSCEYIEMRVTQEACNLCFFWLFLITFAKLCHLKVNTTCVFVPTKWWSSSSSHFDWPKMLLICRPKVFSVWFFLAKT